MHLCIGLLLRGRLGLLVRQVNSLGNVLYDTHVAVAEPVTDYRTFVSGVRWYDLKGAPAFDHVRAQVARVLQGRLLVGHTLRSDLAVRGSLKLPPPRPSFGSILSLPALRNPFALASVGTDAFWRVAFAERCVR